MFYITNTNQFVASNPDINWEYFIDNYKRIQTEHRHDLDRSSRVWNDFFDFCKWFFGVPERFTAYGSLKQHGGRELNSDYVHSIDKDPEWNTYIVNDTFACSVAETTINLVNNTRQRKKLIRRRLKAIFKQNNSVLFVTFTFDNLNTLGGGHHLDQMSDQDKCKLVIDYLKSIGVKDYIVNYDYHKSGEVHFHCVIGFEYLDTHDWSDNLKYGFANARKIKTYKSYVHNKPITEYLCKLSNHCIKASTQGKKVIYSKSLQKFKLGDEKQDVI